VGLHRHRREVSRAVLARESQHGPGNWDRNLETRNDTF
jgi:hypothetical protein